jgi:arylsulfatase A-like enzyme
MAFTRRAHGLLLPALLLPPGPFQGGEGEDPEPPPANVLVLMADDLGVEILTCYGPQLDQPPTPVLDQLALDGVRFNRAWSAPLCTPTRAALQTGRYPSRSGLGDLLGGIHDTDLGPYGLPLEEVILPEIVTQGGGGPWQTACIGKWQLASAAVGGVEAPNIAGYGHFAGTLGNLQPPEESYFQWEHIVDGLAATETGYATTVQVDDALAFIAQATEPWLCSVNFNAPHPPFHAPPPELHTQDLSAAGDPNVDSRPYYKATVEALDTEIGRLLAGLPSPANTLVIFTADNGTPTKVAPPVLNPLKAKGSMFEGGIHVPLIVRGPGVALPGSACDALVDVTDVWATLAEVAGVDPASVLPPEAVLDGKSLLPYLADPTLPSQKTHVISELFKPNAAGAGSPVFTGVGPICQEDLGFGGPGSLALSVCGDVLVGPGKADFLMTGAAPFTAAWVAASFNGNPVPVAGGWLVPQPATTVIPAVTDQNGEIHVNGIGSSIGPVQFYLQAAVLDPVQPFGFAISNAVKLAIQPPNYKAVRDERFKLVRLYNGGADKLYDLLNDPLEEVELLTAGPLSTEAETAYLALQAELDAFILSL